MRICEKCGKEHDGSFGSGRFCSRSCANSHIMTQELRNNISKGLLKKTPCSCRFCGAGFDTLSYRSQHERRCELNPDRVTVNFGAIHNHNEKLKRHVKIQDFSGDSVELDITYADLDDYRESHPVCEICGRTVEDSTRYSGKFRAKNLCIDHDHKTNRFRGLLCQLCNRQLGWYENNKEAIDNYLHKEKYSDMGC